MVLSAIVDISDRKQKERRIEAALKEKDLLLAEIHHRVKNNLQVVHSLLDLQSLQTSDRSVREMLRESQNRVQSMALIHQTLYQSKDFAEVDFRHFLETLVPTLLATYLIDSQRVKLDIAAADVHLPINIAVPCGLIVNELISNALKHGFPENRLGRITAELSTVAEQELQLSVTDDGVGMPEDLVISDAKTLGLQLVLLLTDQLGGELAIQRRNPTRFDIRFPIRR
jgi:two-component system, sensor histidine kinase PdtaS